MWLSFQITSIWSVQISAVKAMKSAHMKKGNSISLKNCTHLAHCETFNTEVQQVIQRRRVMEGFSNVFEKGPKNFLT